jgi:hypothetical protein
METAVERWLGGLDTDFTDMEGKSLSHVTSVSVFAQTMSKIAGLL